jgi:heme A synthase
MPQRGHRYIVAIAAWEWIALATGAFQSSSRITLNVTQLGVVHLVFGLGAVFAVLGLCFCARLDRTASWIAFSSVALSGLTGWISPASPGWVVWHTVFSHLAVGLITAAAVMTSAAWSQPAKPLRAGSLDALRPAAQVTPPIVLIQIAMGALYRHQQFGVMPHMLGAMVVAILALVVSVTMIQHFGDQPKLKNSASALIAVVLVQVCLGIAAFLLLLLGAGNTTGFMWLTTGHVCVGSLTFAASVVAGMQAHRYLTNSEPS